MNARSLGTNGPDLTVLGIGTWAMGGPYAWGWGEAEDDASIATIRHAIEAGINWVDTAPIYGLGHSEEVVGRALAPFRVGEEVFISTKCGLDGSGTDAGGRYLRDLRPATIRSECERSLRRLRVDRLDLYQFHWPDHTTGTSIEDSWATMVDLVREGKVRWIGVSNFEVPQLERCETMRHVDSLQPILNLLHPSARDDLIPWTRDHGTGVIAYSPMASGFLTGKYRRDALHTLPPDDWRRRSPDFQEPAMSRNLVLVERARDVAERVGTNLPSLAVAWVLATSGVTAAIVGARDPRQVDGWLEAAELELPDPVLAELEELTAAEAQV